MPLTTAIVLMALLWKMLADKIKTYFTDRRVEIAQSIEEADKAKTDAEKQYAEYQQKLSNVDKDIREIKDGKELRTNVHVIADISGLDEAIDWSNRSEYGLTAGIFTEDASEVEKFFDEIHAGVTYANRPQGATTGAWPGFQPFGGWKGSGSSGKNAGGHYYLPLYMHEQIRCVVK